MDKFFHNEGPVYRPPSEAQSLLIQATVGCPHNHCTFCMIYKKGPPFRVRSVAEICEDIRKTKRVYGAGVRILNPHEVLMETRDLLERLTCRTRLTSDHYTNYNHLEGRLPQDKKRLLSQIDQALCRSEDPFRPIFVGTQ